MKTVTYNWRLDLLSWLSNSIESIHNLILKSMRNASLTGRVRYEDRQFLIIAKGEEEDLKRFDEWFEKLRNKVW